MCEDTEKWNINKDNKSLNKEDILLKIDYLITDHQSLITVY